MMDMKLSNNGHDVVATIPLEAGGYEYHLYVAECQLQ